MSICPDCNGAMKWHPPFLICQLCGLALRRGEYNKRWREKNKNEGTEPEGKTRKKKMDREEYLQWLLHQKK